MDWRSAHFLTGSFDSCLRMWPFNSTDPWCQIAFRLFYHSGAPSQVFQARLWSCFIADKGTAGSILPPGQTMFEHSQVVCF